MVSTLTRRHYPLLSTQRGSFIGASRHRVNVAQTLIFLREFQVGLGPAAADDTPATAPVHTNARSTRTLKH